MLPSPEKNLYERERRKRLIKNHSNNNSNNNNSNNITNKNNKIKKMPRICTTMLLYCYNRKINVTKKISPYYFFHDFYFFLFLTQARILSKKGNEIFLYNTT